MSSVQKTPQVAVERSRDEPLLTPSQSHDEEDARPGTFTTTCRSAEPAAPANAGGRLTKAAARAQADMWQEATARAVSAEATARELLSALKGVIRVADRQTDEFDAARAAIAKATGGVPLKMVVDSDWLSRNVETDPDLDCEATSPAQHFDGKEAARIAELEDERDDYRERLHDLVMSDAEELAIGGGPGWKQRKEAAWTRAREPFEP